MSPVPATIPSWIDGRPHVPSGGRAGDVWNPDTVSYQTSTALVAEVAGKVWLFTLGAQGAATPGGTKVAEIGPVMRISAPEYLLRINHGSGPPGSKTPVHTHPGSESFYVVEGARSDALGLGRLAGRVPSVAVIAPEAAERDLQVRRGATALRVIAPVEGDDGTEVLAAVELTWS